MEDDTEKPQRYPIYVGGEFVETATVLDVRNPYTGKVFAKTFLAGEEELGKAITAAQKAQRVMAELPSFRKYKILRSISDTIFAERGRLAHELCRESGKPMRYALGEIDRAAQTFLIAAEECKRLPKEYISLDWTPAGEKKEGVVKYFPCGIVAGIAPFNFPLNLAVHKIAPAIAAGCPIILKPASSTPVSTLGLAKIIAKTDLPKGAVSILPMDRETGNRLVTDERFSLLSFTGSPEVGWKMKKNAGKKKVVLELGGNAGVIISQSADLENALKKSLAGGFAYSGQVCIHAQRFFVQRSVFAPFIQRFVEMVSELKTGDPEELTTDISVMIDEENAKRVEQWVNEAVKEGAEILCGGNREGSFYRPTVLTETKSRMKVCAEEIFGPVVTVEPFDSFDEAIAMINHTEFGLQAGVFTNDISEMDRAFSEIHCGGIILNDVPTFRVDHMPYGGVKDSGLGREGVKYAIMDMMEARILVK
ncbi:MAG TPA: aldehyde dehydrogenase family protein [Bacteroidia bacterium]|nr:aldehyde dehydrogenase family protein [Bacteroidia bacterium]